MKKIHISTGRWIWYIGSTLVFLAICIGAIFLSDKIDEMNPIYLILIFVVGMVSTLGTFSFFVTLTSSPCTICGGTGKLENVQCSNCNGSGIEPYKGDFSSFWGSHW